MSYRHAWYSGFDAEPAAVQAFAWSAPMRDLGKLIGISDVALKKLFNRLGIVTPPQGHWNRVAAGKPAATPPRLPARRPGENGRIRLDERFEGHVPAAAPWPTHGPFASAAVPEDLAELRAAECRAIGKVAVPRDLSRPAAGLVRLLRREDEIRRKAAADRFAWRTPHFDRPLEQRKLRILSALFNALAKRGHEGEAYEHDGTLHIRCLIGDTGFGLEFAIVGRHRTEMRRGRLQPATDLPASTPLRLARTKRSYNDAPVGWEDGAGGKLESRLGEIAAEFIVLGETDFREGLAEAERRREEARERATAAERARIAALEARRLEDLKTSGALLAQASELRALVAQVRAAVLAGEVDATGEEVDAWASWALGQADRLDPVKSGQVLAHLRVPELAGALTDGIEPDFT